MDENSHRLDRSTLNKSGINIYVDPIVIYPFVNAFIPFNSVQDISRQKKCFIYMAEGRNKETSVYCGLCTIMSHRETDRHPSHHV